MSSNLEQDLIEGAQQLAVSLDEAQRRALLRLLAELADWNTRINLTAIRDPEEMLRKHLLDSLSVNSYLSGKTIADVGSGAGFPGLPLAVANPQLDFTLIESTGKKARFIQHAADTLGLKNVTVINARAEDYKPGPFFDTVVSRALSSIPDFIRYTQHFVTRDGRLLAMKGQYPTDELNALPRNWKMLQVHRLQVPGLEAERHLVELAR